MCGLICWVIIIVGSFMLHPGLGLIVTGLFLYHFGIEFLGGFMIGLSEALGETKR